MVCDPTYRVIPLSLFLTPSTVRRLHVVAVQPLDRRGKDRVANSFGRYPRGFSNTYFVCMYVCNLYHSRNSFGPLVQTHTRTCLFFSLCVVTLRPGLDGPRSGPEGHRDPPGPSHSLSPNNLQARAAPMFAPNIRRIKDRDKGSGGSRFLCRVPRVGATPNG